MAQRRSGLGSGLDALMPAGPERTAVREVPIDTIHPNPRQPRTLFDAESLAELSNSIREHGIIQPLIVTALDDGSYELIAGERRLRAARAAGIERVPVIVKEASDQQLLELALVENIQRADLNPLEEAQAYQTLKDQFGLSDEQIARRVGKNSRVTIANTRRLLALPASAQHAILTGTITAGHGRAILRFDDEPLQLLALRAIIDGALSVREAERLSEIAAPLHPALRTTFLDGRLTAEQALALNRLPDKLQSAATAAALAGQLNADETYQFVQLVAAGGNPDEAARMLRGRRLGPAVAALNPVQPGTVTTAHGPARPLDQPISSNPEDSAIERMFEELLAMPVHLRRNPRGRGGQLTIDFPDDEALQAIYERLGGLEQQ